MVPVRLAMPRFARSEAGITLFVRNRCRYLRLESVCKSLRKDDFFVILTRTIILAILSCCTIVLSSARPNQSMPNANSFLASQNDQGQNDQNQALRNDLARMKSLVQQMEQNLAFVDTTQSPLKQ